jgi:hypothetical protein
MTTWGILDYFFKNLIFCTFLIYFKIFTLISVSCVAPENSLKTPPQTPPLSGRGFIISELSPIPQRGGGRVQNMVLRNLH